MSENVKVCPLMSDMNHYIVNCKEEECAWWDDNNACCCIQHFGNIAGELRDRR